MRRTAAIFLIFLGIAARSEAQQSWDVGATVGSFGSSPSTPQPDYGDDWYFDGRFAVSIGRYWTEHFKTEIELATTGEGSVYAHRQVTVPGVPSQYPITSQEYYRLQQASARVVWQFLENAWAHPYVFGGVSLDIERRRSSIPEQYFYATTGDPRLPANRILITPAIESGPDYVQRAAGVFGAGAKLYMTPRSYFNAAVITSLAKSSGNISFVGGFGIDF